MPRRPARRHDGVSDPAMPPPLRLFDPAGRIRSPRPAPADPAYVRIGPGRRVTFLAPRPWSAARIAAATMVELRSRRKQLDAWLEAVGVHLVATDEESEAIAAELVARRGRLSVQPS